MPVVFAGTSNAKNHASIPKSPKKLTHFQIGRLKNPTLGFILLCKSKGIQEMPFIFRYKEFVIRFWYSFEERRRHVHAISDDANVKIWLELEISIASVKWRINESMLNELLQEVKKNEQLCINAWDQYLGK